MKIEILASGGIKNAFKELGIEATRTYKGTDKPYYQIWELEKSDMHKMDEMTEWPREDLRDDWKDEPDSEKASFHYSYKEYEEFWKPHKYDCLTDYLSEELGCSQPGNVCALVMDLARYNGMSMSELFSKFEG